MGTEAHVEAPVSRMRRLAMIETPEVHWEATALGKLLRATVADGAAAFSTQAAHALRAARARLPQ